MIINHNLGAMNANRNMNINSSNAAKSMEKLSSGLRINRAGDDAAGLAISEKMRGQIRGLDQASANAQDGISMIQTGEGALSETTSILQRMRELAVQGSSDTNDPNSRNAIQTEMNQLTNEINRIANTTEFNTQKLLNGGSSDTVVNVTKPGVAVGTPLAAVGTVGNIVKVSGTVTAPTAGSTAFTINAPLAAGDTIIVGGHTIKAYATAGDLTAAGDAYGIDISVLTGTGTTAIQQADLIRGMNFATGGITVGGAVGTAALTFTQAVPGVGPVAAPTGTVAKLASIVTTPYDATPGTNAKVTFDITTKMNAGETMTVGGHTITAYADATALTAADDDYGIDVSASADNDATKQADAIATMFTGDANYTVANTGTQLVFTQTTNSAITLASPVIAGAPGPATKGIFNFDASAMKIGDKLTIDNQVLTIATGGSAAQTAAELESLISGNATLSDKYDVLATGTNVVLTQKSGHESAAPAVVSNGDTTLGFTSTLQIGANNGQSFTVNISDMRAAALGVSSGTVGTANGIKADGTADTAGASFTAIGTVTNGTTQAVTEFALDISSNPKATKAIQVIDDATNRVSAERSKLGSYQNRLEHTIANLGTSSENLSSAESRIRDVDMAKEMSTFSKNNILSQAAQAMLAQANQMPQQVLQLLR